MFIVYNTTYYKKIQVVKQFTKLQLKSLKTIVRNATKI